MADFRSGFFCRPDNKKIGSRPEENSKTSLVIPDHKCKPTRVDADERRKPLAVLPGPAYVKTTTETYTEEVYSNSRDESQHGHTKKYYGLHPDEGNNLHPVDFNKLIAKVPRRASQPPEHEMSLSGPMNDIEKAIEYMKEAIYLHSGKNVFPASDHPKKYSYTETIDSKEAARRYGNHGRPPPVQGASVATINCKEAARKYKGATV